MEHDEDIVGRDVNVFTIHQDGAQEDKSDKAMLVD